MNHKAHSRILIVDDDPTSRRIMRAIMAPEGYQIDTLADGSALLARLPALQPDVLLLDVLMPGVDGLQLCRQIKADEHWQHLPIILVTSLNSNEELVAGLDAGADEFIGKPVHAAELQARVRSMIRAKQRTDQLLRLSRARADLANMVVHDMRTPISVCIMRTDILLGRVGVFKQQKPAWLQQSDRGISPEKSLLSIREQLDHLSLQVDEILLLARTEQDDLVLQREVRDLAELLQKVAAQYRDLAEQDGIRLVVEVPAEPCDIPLDVNLAARMVGNLIGNALKFSATGTTITLRLKVGRGGRSYTIQVADQGPGVPKSRRQQIFDRYAVASVQTKGIRSIGLGLAFCKMVAEAHGGRIVVGDNEPRGAVFSVTLPAAGAESHKTYPAREGHGATCQAAVEGVSLEQVGIC